jgi:hypothetical protein
MKNNVIQLKIPKSFKPKEKTAQERMGGIIDLLKGINKTMTDEPKKKD